MKLYPLKFTPIFSYRIWGGEKLKTELNKKYTLDSIGESWEISDIDGSETVVFEGDLKGRTLKKIIKDYKHHFLGKHVYNTFGESFPLLIKFIDAKTPLSIQVHPSNELARERHNSFGKTEMWYVMQAEENANLIVGFNQELEKKTYQAHLENGSLTEVLNTEKVAEGDAFYIPTGRVHAIGAGVLLAEIQQTSNITYRIFDYDRVDKLTGEKRELHNDLAIDAIDFKSYEYYKTSYNSKVNTTNELIFSPYFKTNIINVTGEIDKNYSDLDSFVIFICVDGSLDMVCDAKTITLTKGETLLIPAVINVLKLKAEHAKIIEVYL